MKSMIIKLSIVSTIFMATNAFAHGDAYETVGDAVTESLKIFGIQANKETKQAFQAVKGYVINGKITVKVYIKDSETIVFNCKLDHSSQPEKMVCNN